MKSNIQSVFFAFLAIGLVLFSGCSEKGKEPGWSANIEIIDGIKVITNPEKPKYGDFVFELEEDLSIGDINDEDYFFPRRVTLEVDDDGNIYVCDGGNRRVQKYDKNGLYTSTIGRQGQGPGEYMYPSRLFLNEDGNPIVEGNRSLLHYDKEGIFQKKIQLKGFYSLLIPGPSGTFLGSTQPSARAEGGAKTSLVQVGQDGEPIQTIAEYPVGYSKSLKAIALHWYTNHLAFSLRTFDSFYYGFSSDYKIYAADSDGSILFVFEKDVKPQSISGEEKEQTIKDGIYAMIGSYDREKLAVFPDHRPYFSRILIDDTGRLYVIQFKSILMREETTSLVDVFSKEGIYLYRMNWAFIPALIKNGYLYEVRVNEDSGDVKVIRHKINNWNKFKEK